MIITTKIMNVDEKLLKIDPLLVNGALNSNIYANYTHLDFTIQDHFILTFTLFQFVFRDWLIKNETVPKIKLLLRNQG